MLPGAQAFLAEESSRALDRDEALDLDGWLAGFELTEPDRDWGLPGTGGTSSGVSLNLLANSLTEVCLFPA